MNISGDIVKLMAAETKYRHALEIKSNSDDACQTAWKESDTLKDTIKANLNNCGLACAVVEIESDADKVIVVRNAGNNNGSVELMPILRAASNGTYNNSKTATVLHCAKHYDSKSDDRFMLRCLDGDFHEEVCGRCLQPWPCLGSLSGPELVALAQQYYIEKGRAEHLQRSLDEARERNARLADIVLRSLPKGDQ